MNEARAMTTARVTRTVVIATCVGVVTAACGLFGSDSKESTTTGASAAATATASTTAAAKVITPNDANSVLLSSEDVSELVGSELEYEDKSSNPGSFEVEGNQACRSLMGPLTIEIGDSWTTYRNVWYQESEKTYTHAVNQRVLLYPAAEGAQTAFSKGFPADIRDCSGEQLKSGTTTWRETVREVAEDRVQWVEEEIVDDKPVGWRCSREARIVDNLLLAVAVCQRGNGTPAAKAIMERMTAAAKPK